MPRIFLCFLLLLNAMIVVGQSESPEQVLTRLKLQIPPFEKPNANYVKFVRSGNMIYLAGHIPCGEPAPEYKGKLGTDLTIEQGYKAARQTTLCLLATLKEATGDLSKVKRIIRVFGMVNSSPEFIDQPKVMNGCSDLLVEVFGEKGKHARAAVGMVSLPNNSSVEIEMIVEVND